MTKKNAPVKMERAFLSKEINFLKFDSEPEKQTDPMPDEYLSDRIRSQKPWMEDFTDRLEKSDIPGSAFVCAVVNLPLGTAPLAIPPVDPAADSDQEQTREKGQVPDGLPDLGPDQGLIQRIDHRYIVLALWNQDQLDPILSRIRESCCSGAESDPIVGTAVFPFMDFSRKETFYNAVKAVDHAAFLGPGSKAAFGDISLNISGDRLYQLGFMDEAALEYQRGISINPDNINLMNSLGVCHAMNNDSEQAKKAFETALLKDPMEVMVVYNLGLVCNILDQGEQALLYLEKASRIDSSIFEIELTTGSLHLKEGRLHAALPHLTRAKKLNTCAALPYRLLGEYYLGSEKIPGPMEKSPIKKAIVEFKQAVKLNPMDAVSLSGLAHAFYLTNKNLQIAITLAEESIRIDPDTPLFHSRLGNLYLETGQKELAQRAFAMAEKIPGAIPSLFQNTQTLPREEALSMTMTRKTNKKRIA